MGKKQTKTNVEHCIRVNNGIVCGGILRIERIFGDVERRCLHCGNYC